MHDLTNQEISDKKDVKRKAVIDSSKVKKTRININEPDNEQENNLCSEIDIEERNMKLAERQLAYRRAQAEIEKLELENIKLLFGENEAVVATVVEGVFDEFVFEDVGSDKLLGLNLSTQIKLLELLISNK
ncbi:12828_t:CDS:2 [Funneliformis caledonium]|uniref:12828_t:CDS:1 n=1 Tax=Funneliformis caledonium TaxID=1117310 RepID=A0A9N9BBL3_9GLOM|nr:12828_t:CDS:2 [Funneliformis caledonium]